MERRNSRFAKKDAIPAIVLAFAFGALLLPLMFQPLWRDEGTTFIHAGQHSLGDVLQSVRLGELTPPLYFVVEYLWVRVAGTSEFVLRLPSLLATALAVGFLYDTAQRIRSPLAGYATAACACMTPLALFVGTEARPYALTLFLAAIAMWLIALLLFSERCNVLAIAGSLAVAVAALCWTHYTAWAAIIGLALAAPAIGFGSAPKRRFAYLVAILVGAAAAAPLVRKFAAAAATASKIAPDPGNLFHRIDDRLISFNPLLVAEPLFVALLLVGIMVWLFRTANSWRAQGLSAESQFLFVCLSVVVCGVGASVARSVPAHTHLAAYAPAAWLIIGNFYARLASWLRAHGDIRDLSLQRRCALVLFATISIFAIIAFPFTYAYQRRPNSGSLALVQQLRQLVGPDVTVIAVPDVLAPSLKYYLGDDSRSRLRGIPTWSRPWYYGYMRDVNATQKKYLLRQIDDATRQCGRVAFAVDWGFNNFLGINYDGARDIVREEIASKGVAFRRVFPGTVETMELVLLRRRCSRPA